MVISCTSALMFNPLQKLRGFGWMPLLVALFLTTTLYAQEQKPRLIVVITVDPLSPVWLETFQNHFSTGGFRKLSEEGLVFSQAQTNQFLSSRSSSVATLSTGAPSAVHGIIGTSWYDRLKRDELYCTEDYESTDFVNFGSGKRHSAHRLLVTTVGDVMVNLRRGKNISISLEPDAAILGGGHQGHGTYWLDLQNGKWTSNSRFIPQLPQWVIEFNNQNRSDQLITETWDLIKGSPYPEAMPDKSAYEFGLFGESTTFPYRLSKMKKGTTEGPFEVIRHTPAGNKLMTEFAIEAISREQLGADGQTDLLTLTYTGFKQILNQYGPESQEFADALVRLDMDLQNLLYVLNEKVGKEKTLVIFTATHGSSWNVDLAMNQKFPAGKFRVRNAIALLNSYLSAIYGENYWIESYINQQIYLDHTLIDKNQIPIDDIQEQAARFLLQFRGLSNAYTSKQISNLQVEGQSGYPVVESFNTKRSGDILINLQPGWIQDGNFVSDHLSVHPYDQHVPLVFWGYKINPQTVSLRVNQKQIASTVCDLSQLPYPNGCQGESLLPYLIYNFEAVR